LEIYSLGVIHSSSSTAVITRGSDSGNRDDYVVKMTRTKFCNKIKKLILTLRHSMAVPGSCLKAVVDIINL